jgi:hypothetical protein
METEDQPSEPDWHPRPQSALESRNQDGFHPDWSFETLVSIFLDVEKASPVQLRHLINTVGPVLSRLAYSDQLLFSSLLKEKLMKQLEKVQELHHRSQNLGKSPSFRFTFCLVKTVEEDPFYKPFNKGLYSYEKNNPFKI